MRYHWQPELSWLITYWSIALAPMFIAFSLLFERTKIPNHFFVLFATFVILVGLGFHRYFIIEDDGKLRIVALNPFRRSRVAIAQIQTIEVNKSGIVMKIKTNPIVSFICENGRKILLRCFSVTSRVCWRGRFNR